jgi:hypothetical protein
MESIERIMIRTEVFRQVVPAPPCRATGNDGDFAVRSSRLSEYFDAFLGGGEKVQTSRCKDTSNRLSVQAITPRRVIHARLKPEFKRNDIS